MSKTPRKSDKDRPADERAARLKSALKSNMAKRKAQARARKTKPDPGETEQ